MRNTFFSYSFGCRVNEAEKEEIDRQMLEAGFKYSASNPSIYIINTCSVTAKAEREARQRIYQIKRKFPSSKIVVTGCSATYWKKNKLALDLPIDEIYDNLQKEYLVQLLLKRQSQKNYSRSSNTRSKFLDSGRLLVKIQDGCQRFCSFCIVPYLRGQPKSYSIQYLVSSIQKEEKQIKEVILTAINTEAFGYETGETFIDLIQSIIAKTNIPRISFGSIHPWSITQEFIEFYKKTLLAKRIVGFFHIPLQSGSNKILTLMKRGYTREEMIETLQLIKKVNPFAFIGTDIIVGFLDETDKDFEETYTFFEQAPIDKFHIFRFSKRQNTAAYFLSKQFMEPSPQTKIKRAKALAELEKHKYEAFLQKHVATTFPALFLKNRIEDFQEALLSNQIPIFVKSSRNYIGQLKNINIYKFQKGRLFGKIV